MSDIQYEGVAYAPLGPLPAESNLYTDQKIYQYGQHGPFNQTLFLGCSIVNFNVNLGWGAEASSLTVSLVNDDSPHWLSSKFVINDNNAKTGNQLAKQNPFNDINSKITFDSYNITSTSPDILPETFNSSAFDTSTVKGFGNSVNISPDLHRNILLKEEKKKIENTDLNNLLQTASPNRADLGKVYYELLYNGACNKKYWFDKDPGFVGESYDILGTTVRFIFNDFEFIGIVTSWKNNGGSSGKNLYTVEIKSLTSLLKNTQLIIDYYPGTIFRALSGVPTPFADDLVNRFGFPSNNVGTRFGREDNLSSIVHDYQQDDFTGSVSAGNLPNVFNIYGYLQTTAGWGKHDINAEGAIVRDIIVALDDLVNKSPAGTNSGIAPDLPKIIDARFSPYGRIIGKAPALIKQSGVYKNGFDTSTIRFLKDQYQIIDPYTEQFKALVEADIATTELESGSVTVSEQQLITNSDIKLNEMGLLPAFSGTDGIIRQHYKIDISELPIVPSGFRISGPIISVLDLVQHVCEANNHDYFVDFQPNGNTIKIRTVSRQQQPSNSYIGRIIKDTENRNILTSYDYGIEYHDEATIRSMYIGAKQKRLLQVTSNFLSRKNNGLIFDPKLGKPLFHELSSIKNIVRYPDPFILRNPNHDFYQQLHNIPSTPVVSGTGSIVYENRESRWDWGENVGQGSYINLIGYDANSEVTNIKDSTKLPDIDIFADVAGFSGIKAFAEDNVSIGDSSVLLEYTESSLNSYNYPLWDDIICPYFGLDIDGTARKVYFDTGMQQIQVLCSISDIQNILGFALTKAANISSTTVKQTDNQNGIPRPTELVTTSLTDQELAEITHDPARMLTQGIGNTMGSYDVQTFHTQWNLKNREYYSTYSKFLLLENEIRAAIAGFDSWVYYTFNKNFTTDLGKILRLTLMSTTGMIVTEKTDSTLSQVINNGEPVVTMVYHGADPHLIGNNAVDSPNSSASMMNDRVNDMLQKIHGYVKNIGDTYYGKQFMVKIPGVSISQDRPLVASTGLSLNYPINATTGIKFHLEEYNGAGKFYSNYKPASDGAWEEPGNILDDTIIIGSITGDFLTNDDGRFGPILGYKASYEFLNDTIPDETLNNATKPDLSSTNPKDTPIKFINQNEANTNYSSIGHTAPPGGITTQDIIDATLQNTVIDPAPSTAPSHNPPTLAMILAQASQPATGVDIIPNEWYPSVVTSLANNEYIYYPYNITSYPRVTQLSTFTFCDDACMGETAYGKSVPSSGNLSTHLKYKLYAKASIEDNFIFISTIDSTGTGLRPNYREPRAVVSLSSPIECNPVHLADKYIHHCLMLDASIFKIKGASVPHPVIKDPLNTSASGTLIGGLVHYSGGFSMAADIITNATDHFLDGLNAIDKDANRAVTMPIAPKAAMPGFAAIPIENQTAVYGPWTNYPWMVRKDIFTDSDINESSAYLKDSIENLVGGLKVQVVDELAPWKFGGMKNLDIEAIARIEGDACYQIQQEYGTLSFPGSPIYRLGDFVDKNSALKGGPVINSIRANIAEGGVSTEYSLRTFSRKFGLFNKDNANKTAQISSERLARRKAIAVQAAEVSNRNVSTIKSKTLNDAPKRNYVNPPIPLSWRSSSELLVGHNDIAFRLPFNARTGNNTIEGINHISGLTEYSCRWGFNPVWKVSGVSGLNVFEYPKLFSTTQLMDSREATPHLQTSYENTSFMSLDGLLSPISFYPTENFRTYHITKYPRRACRYCFGKGKLQYSAGLPGLVNTLQNQSFAGFTPNNTQKASTSKIDCPFCEPETNKVEQLLAGSSRGRVIPPFILTTGTDSVDSNKNLGSKDGLTTHKTIGTIINYSTLNPAMIAYGEFSNFQNRQSGDLTGNSIRMLGIGTVPPNHASESLNQMYCGDNYLFKTNLEYDQLYLDKVKELYAIPTEKRSENINKIIGGLPEKIVPFSNNARFFGFRGPMMLHGWGYDTEGYPVPNSSGELQYSEGLEPITATGVDDSSYVVNVYKNQKFVEVNEEDAADLDSSIILVKSQDGTKQGYWTDPFREPTFAKGWAQVPSTWPVGPIDLRWDSKAKIWTIPSSFKNVYVLLEEDLNNNIARGELIDNSQDMQDQILALGYRKTVYVRDTMGIYTAPRSSIVYCAYDQDGGFYEPVSQASFTTSGEIISQNTAKLYKIFQRKLAVLNNTVSSENEPATYIAQFSNPLDLDVSPGSMSLFTYLKGGWIVQSSRG